MILNSFYSDKMFDYKNGTFPSEAQAADKFFSAKGGAIQKIPVPHTPSFVIKT